MKLVKFEDAWINPDVVAGVSVHHSESMCSTPNECWLQHYWRVTVLSVAGSPIANFDVFTNGPKCDSRTGDVDFSIDDSKLHDFMERLTETLTG